MKYYRNIITGEVFAFELDGSQDAFITEDMVRLTPEEEYDFLNPTPNLSVEEIRNMRRWSYSDPTTGSDRLFVEYQREIAMNASAEVIEAVKQHWLNRALEIEAQYPWPTTP